MSGWPRPGCRHESQESSWSTLRATRSRLEWCRRMRGLFDARGEAKHQPLASASQCHSLVSRCFARSLSIRDLDHLGAQTIWSLRIQ